MPRHSPYALFRLNFFKLSSITSRFMSLVLMISELLEFLLNKYLFGLLRLIILWKGFPLRCTLNLLPPGSSRILGNCIYPNLERLNLTFHFPSSRTVLWNNLILSSLSVRFTLQYTLFGFQWTYPALSSCVHFRVLSGPKWTRTTDLALIRRAL